MTVRPHENAKRLAAGSNKNLNLATRRKLGRNCPASSEEDGPVPVSRLVHRPTSSRVTSPFGSAASVCKFYVPIETITIFFLRSPEALLTVRNPMS
jgi:hypothetical protein